MSYEDVELTPVESSNLQAVAYDAVEKTLYIQFNYQNRVYSYADVPADVFDGLMSAGSKGLYFNANIKDRFAYEIVA